MQKYKLEFLNDEHGLMIMKELFAEFAHDGAAFKYAHSVGHMMNVRGESPLEITYIRVNRKVSGQWMVRGQDALRKPMRFKIEYFKVNGSLHDVEFVDLPDSQAAHDWAEQQAEDINAVITSGDVQKVHRYHLYHGVPRPQTQFISGVNVISNSEQIDWTDLGIHSTKPWYETRDIGKHELRKQADETLNEIKLPETE